MGSVGEGGGGLATMREMRVREREVSWECTGAREGEGLIQGK